ncbi:MAG TPA: thioredoxin fold domain-containing protein [Thiohalobacter sp.]|nr:thioredoxin fold domain-containing protein [Thiohalobacter sp.]
MKQAFKFITGGLLLLWLLGQGVAGAGTRPEVQEVQSLAQATREAAARGLPLLLAFSSRHCAYCDQVEQDFLVPMLISGDYEDRVLIRKLNIDAGIMVGDLQGEIRPARRIADEYGVDMTPTLLFLGPDGEELAKRVVGLLTPDFYGGYIDRGIDTARAALGQ